MCLYGGNLMVKVYTVYAHGLLQKTVLTLNAKETLLSPFLDPEPKTLAP